MKAKWTHTLRFRLTAWYTSALALVLGMTALMLYFGIRHTLIADTDAFLTVEARQIASVAAGKPGDPPEKSDLTEAVNIPNTGRSHAIYLRLLDERGKTALVESPNLAQQPALIGSLDDAFRAAPSHRAEFAYAGPDEERMMRVLTEPIHIGPNKGFVQVAAAWDHNADILDRLSILLWIGLPAVLLIAVAGSWMLIGRTLHPIGRIVAEAERLDAEMLPIQLLPDPVETDSEIGQLVATLNSMTTRLRHAFETERRFAESQQRFAADASHELRTPLTILRGEIDLALTRPREIAAYQATMHSAVEEIDRMTRIVEGLGFLARRETDKLLPNSAFEPVDLVRLCGIVIAEFAPQAAAKAISLQDIPPKNSKSLSVSGSADQLHQLLRNLVDNALKYTPCGGSVTITAERSASGEAIVTVSDTGVGIAPAELPHVFDRFWRSEQTRTASGSGLGLAICAQIAEAHGGTLTTKSQLGVGSKFRIILPP